jgi:hypothetical protein
MTDLEMTKLCAEAMGIPYLGEDNQLFPKAIVATEPSLHVYAPLDDDAQAMALVKKFLPRIEPPTGAYSYWRVYRGDLEICSENLNRAIVECVAKMQKSRETYK